MVIEDTTHKYDTVAILAASCYVPVFGETMTVREYFIELLAALWEECDGFSGKRPFGESGWYLDMAPALINAGLIDGTISPEGYVDSVGDEYDDMMKAAIAALEGATP